MRSPRSRNHRRILIKTERLYNYASRSKTIDKSFNLLIIIGHAVNVDNVKRVIELNSPKTKQKKRENKNVPSDDGMCY